MDKFLKRISTLLFLLLLMCLNIFSITGLESVKNVHADEIWRGTPGSYSTWRMGNIEETLKEIKSKLEPLALRKERYIKNNADDIRSRLTKKYNKDVAALDQELVDDYNRYKARPENRNLVEGVTKPEWRRTPRAKDLLAATELRKRQLRVEYFADLKKLENGTLRSGLDNIFDGIDQEQNALLLRQRELNEELRFLKTHTEEEAKARRDRRNPGFKFKVIVIGNTVRNVNIGDTEEVELAIPTGTMPLTLEIIAEDGSKEVKTLTRSGRLVLPFRFTTPGNKTRLFRVTDSSFPGSSNTANVMFIVLDNTSTIPPTKTPAPTGDNQGPDLSVTSHNDNPALAWTRVTAGTITLSGTTTDMNRGDNGIQSIYINSNLADSGSTATDRDTANWSEELSLSSGWNKIIIEAYDNSPDYNKTHKTIWIYFDAPDAQDEPGPPPPVPVQEEPFSAKLDCGDSFELSPNEILYPKICNVLVGGYNNSDEPVRVTVIYDNSILRVFPDDQSVQPYLMYPSTAGPHSGYYVFSINLSTISTAPVGETAAVVIVRQGMQVVRFPLTILVLSPGQEPSSGTGIRPPAEVATGSAGDSPDAYCVWRYKSFGDRPECFNFVRAECDTPRYSSSRYELVGSGMTRMESAARMAQLGSYHDDAYGCHTSTETDDGADGTGRGTITGQVVRNVSALNITPESVTLKIGNSQSFTAIAVYSDNLTEVVSGAQWSGDEGAAGNTFTASEAGNFTITAKYQGISGSASITVVEPVPTTIEISPSDSNIKINEAVDFTATVTFDDGHTEINPGGLTWHPGSSFTGNKAGEYTITAKYKGVSGTAMVTVQDFYGDAKAALQSCGFEKARSLINQMLAGPKKSELEQEYKASVELENRLKALVDKANGEYKGGKYRDAFSTLHDALSEAKCDKHLESINKKIALVNKALLKPYNKARVALQVCDFEKYRSLIDQMPDGPKRTELEQEYQGSMELEDNLKAMVNQARNDYKGCNYDEALTILNKALSQAKCSKHIESIKNKISMAENRKVHEGTTQRLHEEAKSLYKRKDYAGAQAKLQQAYNHTKCDRYKDSLSSMIAKVQGKRKPSPEEQVAALDCSHYGSAEAYWDESEKKAKCRCKSGYKPSGNTCAPTRETLVQDLDCRAYPNTYAAWDNINNRAACFCINNNFKWRRDGKGCIPKSGDVIQQDPMCPAAIYSIKNKLRSGDNSMLTLLANNAKSMGCTDPVIDQVLSGGGTGDCSQCGSYENWLQKNARACGYHGNRLPSICDMDPECIRWNKECNRVKKQLRECLAQCQNR